MATGNIRGGKRNYAKPTTLSTSVISASTSVAGVDIVIPSTQIGAGASSYLVTGTSNDGGAAVSTNVTGSTTSATGFTGGKNYSVTIAGRNYNGLGDASGTAAILIPEQYALRQTFTADGTYTIPTGSTKLAGIVISTGGTGGRGGDGTNSCGHPGGGGGGSGAVAAFWEFAVTAGQTATITIGSSNTASKVTYDGTDIATANAGGVGSTNNELQNTANPGGSGGTASSNISTNRLLVNGYTGASGSLGVGTNNNQATAENGANATATGSPNTETLNFSTTTFAFSPNSTVSVYLASGGGGGGGAFGSNNGANRTGGTGSAGGAVRGGSGGNGGNTRSGDSGVSGNVGNAANAIGCGGGGGGGRPGSVYSGGAGQTGGAGGAATIYIYTR